MNRLTETIDSLFSMRKGGKKKLHLWGFCFFLTACTQADGLQERDGVTVRFSLASHSADVEVTPTRANATDMTAGTTVRVLAYRRPVGAAEAVLNEGNFVSEATYKVTSLGMLQADSEPLQLIQGEYDFYAVTPALVVNHNGAAPTVNVNHRTDYAVSLTAGTITPGNGMVSLSTLERRCSLLSFETDLKEGVTGITSIRIAELRLTNMTNEPLTATGTAALATATDITTGLTLTDFTYNPDKPYQAKGQLVVLPKPEGAFKLTMNVAFNGGASTALDADLDKIRFEAGNHYTFFIHFRQRDGIYVDLLLAVTPWQQENLSGNIGEVGELPVPISLGHWTLETLTGSIGELGDTSLTITHVNWTQNTLSGSIGGLGNVNIGGDVGDWEDCNGSYELGK